MFITYMWERVSITVLALVTTAAFIAHPTSAQAHESFSEGKVKVLYHVDGSDPAVAKYAMALINKHIEAEGGSDKIDVKLVVHGPALSLFD
ncbi:MAG: hypothetical protein ACE5MM_07260, partial [Nitrospiraceae bacterium]